MDFATHLKLSHGGQDSNLARLTYVVENRIEALFAGIKSYPVDMDILQAELQAARTELGEAKRVVKDAANGLEFNANSTKDLETIFTQLDLGLPIPKTAKGRASITKDWLSANVDAHPLLKLISAQRSKTRKLSAIQGFLKWCSQGSDGRWSVSCNWRTISEKGTGRLFAENYSVTQTPVELRRAFRAPDGKVWFYIDLSQAELRFLASLAEDEALIADINRGDVYLGMAERFGLEPSSTNREKVKTFVYAFLYGSTDERKMAALVGFSDLSFFRNAYPVLNQFLRDQAEKTLQTGFIDLIYGQRLRDLSLDQEANSNAVRRRKTYNSLGQQNVAFLTKQIICHLMHELPELETNLWLPVFDSISCTTFPDRVPQILKALQEFFDALPLKVIFKGKWAVDKAWPASRPDVLTRGTGDTDLNLRDVTVMAEEKQFSSPVQQQIQGQTIPLFDEWTN
jgi:DNA polymerase-1